MTTNMTPQQTAWHDAYAMTESLWEESRSEHEEFNEDELAQYRASLEEVLEHLDEKMQGMKFPNA